MPLLLSKGFYFKRTWFKTATYFYIKTVTPMFYFKRTWFKTATNPSRSSHSGVFYFKRTWFKTVTERLAFSIALSIFRYRRAICPRCVLPHPIERLITLPGRCCLLAAESIVLPKLSIALSARPKTALKGLASAAPIATLTNKSFAILFFLLLQCRCGGVAQKTPWFNLMRIGIIAICLGGGSVVLVGY